MPAETPHHGEVRKTPIEIVVLSGPSGAGKTAALHALEDVGYYCIDNLPTALVPALLNLTDTTAGMTKIALVIDVRERSFGRDIGKVLDHLAQVDARWHVEVVYLECDAVTLTNRFKATRRPHPLVAQGLVPTLEEALAMEREALASFREHAGHRVIDTSQGTVHDLRRTIQGRYGASEPPMALQLVSFGFHEGLPPEADFVFDVRFLDNPFFHDQLKEKTGLDPAVASFVMQQPMAVRMRSRIVQLLDELWPAIEFEDRATLTIAIGCTGGRHRSVAMVDAVRVELEARGYHPLVRHRDIAV